MFQNNLLQLVHCPIHSCGNKNLLDLFITNYDKFITSLFVHPYNTGRFTSDHYLISFAIPLNQPQQSHNVVTYVHQVIFKRRL